MCKNLKRKRDRKKIMPAQVGGKILLQILLEITCTELQSTIKFLSALAKESGNSTIIVSFFQSFRQIKIQLNYHQSRKKRIADKTYLKEKIMKPVRTFYEKRNFKKIILSSFVYLFGWSFFCGRKTL